MKGKFMTAKNKLEEYRAKNFVNRADEVEDGTIHGGLIFRMCNRKVKVMPRNKKREMGSTHASMLLAGTGREAESTMGP